MKDDVEGVCISWGEDNPKTPGATLLDPKGDEGGRSGCHERGRAASAGPRSKRPPQSSGSWAWPADLLQTELFFLFVPARP